QAVRQSRQSLPPESAMAAALGHDTGDLAAALEATTYASQFERSWLQPAISRLVYLLAMLMAFNVVVMYLRVRILPSYVRIFDDFDQRLPDATIAFISQVPTPRGQWQVSNPMLALPEFVLDWLTFNYPGPLLIALVSFGWLSVLTVGSVLIVLALLLYAWLQWRGTLMPRLPVLRKVITWVDMGPILRGVALAARHNRPLVGVLVAMARLHPKRTVRRRLRRVVRDLDNGIPWYDGLRRQRLIDRNDAVLLAAAGSSGNLAWALTETAAGFERRATYRLQALAQTFLPLLVLPVGLLTALIAVAYFLPLVDLVIHLS
ncbi:MAG: type II secretion system F family protein, partial [Pirellulales bacterium]